MSGFGGIYNMVLGDGHEVERAQTLLVMLGFTSLSGVGRFRDCWVENHGGTPVVAVYTRNGGGNREHFSDEKEAGPDCGCTGCIITYNLPQHPHYMSDRDDSFDSTYATVYFSVPEEYVEAAKGWMQDPVDMSKVWQDAIAQLQQGMVDEREV